MVLRCNLQGNGTSPINLIKTRSSLFKKKCRTIAVSEGAGSNLLLQFRYEIKIPISIVKCDQSSPKSQPFQQLGKSGTI